MAKVTPAKVHKIQKDLVKTIDLLKKNFPLYKAALDANDEKKLKKHREIAVKLTKKKKDLESDLDKALGGLYQDAELELTEIRMLVRNLIKETIKEADVFDTGAGATGDDEERDVSKLRDKFEGVLEPMIDKINTKEELNQAIQLLLSKVEENKPGLGSKAKILLRKTIQNL
jgi:CRISPR/Cas system CSM-associated protein Csm2 small subunit